MKEKLQLLFVPLLTTQFWLILIYTALHWLISVQLRWINPDSIFLTFILPLLLCGLITLGKFVPRIRILNLPPDKIKHGVLAYTLAVWAGLTLPLAFTQDYMINATAKLTELKSPKEIPNENYELFYKFKTCYLDRKNIATKVEVNGEDKALLELVLKVFLPVSDKENDTTKTRTWLAVTYKKYIDNKENDPTMNLKMAAFVSNTIKAVDTISNSYAYVKTAELPYDDEAFEDNPRYAGKEKGSIILEPVYTPFRSRADGGIDNIFKFIFMAVSLWLPMSLIPSINQEKLAKWKAGVIDEPEVKKTPPPIPV